MEEKKKQIQQAIEVSNEVLKGVYANNVLIMHTKGEFLLDFMTMFYPKGILGARVIVSPSHAKRIAKALQENIAKYEQKFGEIIEAEEPSVPFSGTH